MDSDGNILVKRISKENVFVKLDMVESIETCALSNEILQSEGVLDYEKPMKVGDKQELGQEWYKWC